MKKIFILLFLCFIFSCKAKNFIPEKCLDKAPIAERRYLRDNTASYKFPKEYKIENLIKSEVYIAGNIINFNFIFSDKVSLGEIKMLRTYFSKIISQDTSMYFVEPYFEVRSYITKNSITKIRIFIDKELLLYNSFDFNTNKIDYFENTSIDIGRKLKHKQTEMFIKYLSELSDDTKGVRIIQTLKGFVVCVIINNESKIEDTQIKAAKKYIEQNIASELEDSSKQLYGMNINALGIALEININNDKKYYSFYLNGKEKKWLDIDWNLFDFYKEFDD